MTAAALMFQSGAKARAVSAKLNIPVATAARWEKKGVPLQVEQVEHLNGTLEQMSGTGWNALEQEQPENVKIAILTPEISVPPVPQTTEQATKTQSGTAWNWLLDGVYFFTIGTGCLAMWNIFGVWAVSLIAPYALISFHALSMAKDPEITQTAERARGAVVVLEFIASVFDIALFHDLLWRDGNYKKLPFQIREAYIPEIEGWGWHNGWIPIATACFVSVCLFAAAFYAVDTRLAITRERAKK